MMVLGGRTFERCFYHESGILMMVLVLYKTDPTEILSLFYKVRTKREGVTYKPRRRPSQEHVHAGSLILDFQASRTVFKNFNKISLSKKFIFKILTFQNVLTKFLLFMIPSLWYHLFCHNSFKKIRYLLCRFWTW